MEAKEQLQAFTGGGSSSFLDPNVEGKDFSVSQAFHPGAFEEISDTVFLSSDSVLFYIHSSIITKNQPYAFRRLTSLPLTNQGCRDRIIKIEESSSVLSIMLHALYDTPVSPAPTFDVVVAAVEKMRLYEISPALQVTSQTQLYKLILSFAPVWPLEVYALAAFHRLDCLAVECSSHLTLYPLASITDEIAAKIGTSYLLRLFRWKLHRTSEMKRIFLKPIYPHVPTRQCPFDNQKTMMQIWAEISAQVGFEDHSDLTLTYLESLLDPHMGQLDCDLCKENIRNKIRDVIIEWNTVPEYSTTEFLDLGPLAKIYERKKSDGRVKSPPTRTEL